MGRIRTIKPEWLEDEKMLLASPSARVLSIALILMADDYGRGPGNEALIVSRIFPGHSRLGSEGFAELLATGYFSLYEVRGQTFYQITNWEKHQRVDKPGKPRTPDPCEGCEISLESLANFPGSLATDQGPRPRTTTKDQGPTPAPRKRRRASVPLPPEWVPSAVHIELARERGLNVTEQATRFRDHAEANDRRQVDWDAAFRNWLRSDFQQRRTNNTQAGRGLTAREIWDLSEDDGEEASPQAGGHAQGELPAATD